MAEPEAKVEVEEASAEAPKAEPTAEAPAAKEAPADVEGESSEES